MPRVSDLALTGVMAVSFFVVGPLLVSA